LIDYLVTIEIDYFGLQSIARGATLPRRPLKRQFARPARSSARDEESVSRRIFHDPHARSMHSHRRGRDRRLMIFGRASASGVHFYKLDAGAFAKTKKTALLRQGRPIAWNGSHGAGGAKTMI
jgi:hypothetical protein